MAIDDKWERHNYFQKHGRYPETSKQQKAREAKERDLAENGPSEPGHSALSVAQNEPESHTDRVVREWWAKHPHLR